MRGGRREGRRWGVGDREVVDLGRTRVGHGLGKSGEIEKRRRLERTGVLDAGMLVISG